ncbi:MAG: SagB/ThcOx family dehydrogenase, partial [Clostridia bacterium]|nr:SagB/ThcOx family dehydrogenase [Clostridia bacterium]
MFKTKKEFLFVYMKMNGYDHETMVRELEITQEEYNRFEIQFESNMKSIEAENEASKGIGFRFQKLTSYLYKVVSDQQNGVKCPPPYKTIEGDLIELPDIKEFTPVADSFSQLNQSRKSRREYSDEPLTLKEISYLLWHTQSVKKELKNERVHIGFRFVPSAGCRHPFETYLQINRVEGLQSGLYFYQSDKHALILLNNSSETKQFCTDTCAGQGIADTAAVVFMWTAIPYRTTWRYCQRGFRYIYL